MEISASFSEKNKISVRINITTIFDLYTKTDFGLVDCLVSALNEQGFELSEAERELITKKCCFWLGTCLYGKTWRVHSGGVGKNLSPEEFVRYVGGQIERGYLKHIPNPLSEILANHNKYADRRLMVEVFRFIQITKPISKLSFKLNNKPGRFNLLDIYSCGDVFSILRGNMHDYKQKQYHKKVKK